MDMEDRSTVFSISVQIAFDNKTTVIKVGAAGQVKDILPRSFVGVDAVIGSIAIGVGVDFGILVVVEEMVIVVYR